MKKLLAIILVVSVVFIVVKEKGVGKVPNRRADKWWSSEVTIEYPGAPFPLGLIIKGTGPGVVMSWSEDPNDPWDVLRKHQTVLGGFTRVLKAQDVAESKYKECLEDFNYTGRWHCSEPEVMEDERLSRLDGLKKYFFVSEMVSFRYMVGIKHGYSGNLNDYNGMYLLDRATGTEIPLGKTVHSLKGNKGDLVGECLYDNYEYTKIITIIGKDGELQNVSCPALASN